MKIQALCAALLLAANTAAAEAELLTSADLEYRGQQAKAELWGEQLPGGYSHRLQLLLKDGRGHVLTAYTPGLAGGYHALLQPVQVKPADSWSAAQSNKQSEEQEKALPMDKATAEKQQDGEKMAEAVPNAKPQGPSQQLLLSLGRSDWNGGRDYLLLDMENTKAFKELLAAKDNLGMIKELRPVEHNVEHGVEQPKEYGTEPSRDNEIKQSVQILLHSGSKNILELPVEKDELSKIEYRGLDWVVPHDLDGDGVQELLVGQALRYKDRTLATLGATWSYNAKEQCWQEGRYTLMTGSESSSSVNMGTDLVRGSVLAVRIVMPGGEATYPIISIPGKPQLQQQLNAALMDSAKPYLDDFYAGRVDLAFRITANTPKLLSLQLVSGKDSFQRLGINLDPANGSKLELDDILLTKKRGLMKLLQENKEYIAGKQLPQNWYLEDDVLYLVQKQGTEEHIAAYPLGKLEAFLRQPVRVAYKKLTTQSAKDEKETKNEKNKEK